MNAPHLDENDYFVGITETAPKSLLTKAFAKTIKQGTMNRLLLSRFVDLIANPAQEDLKKEIEMYRLTVNTEPHNQTHEHLPPVPVTKAWLYHTDTNTWLLHLEGQFGGVGVSAARADAGICIYDPYGHFRPVEIRITCTDKNEF
jgi:hypothetical protein